MAVFVGSCVRLRPPSQLLGGWASQDLDTWLVNSEAMFFSAISKGLPIPHPDSVGNKNDQHGYEKTTYTPVN